MYRQVPNALTILRLVLAGVFFLILNQYRYQGSQGDPQTLIIWISIVLFVAATLTDALDGHLARKWKVESAFGRVMDPFCDKVLVIGAFIYLSGPRFVIHEEPTKMFLRIPLDMISGVYPWMVVIMLARELLVTGIRGELEDSGVQFPAKLSGKLKMILQSVGVPVILGIVWLNPRQVDRQWLGWVRDGLVYTTVLVTALSGWPYITGAVRALKEKK